MIIIILILLFPPWNIPSESYSASSIVSSIETQIQELPKSYKPTKVVFLAAKTNSPSVIQSISPYLSPATTFKPSNSNFPTNPISRYPIPSSRTVISTTFPKSTKPSIRSSMQQTSIAPIVISSHSQSTTAPSSTFSFNPTTKQIVSACPTVNSYFHGTINPSKMTRAKGSTVTSTPTSVPWIEPTFPPTAIPTRLVTYPKTPQPTLIISREPTTPSAHSSSTNIPSIASTRLGIPPIPGGLRVKPLPSRSPSFRSSTTPTGPSVFPSKEPTSEPSSEPS